MVPKRKLGNDGPLVSAIGYGAMGLEGYYGGAEEHDALATIQHALDTGTFFIDTADAYGNGHNEELIARAVARRREEAFIATKFGIVFESDQQGTEVPTGWGFSLNINGSPDYVRRALNRSLQRLNVEHIDLWYIH